MTILLIAYGIFLLCAAAFGASAIYHAVRFGFPGDRTRLAIGLYLVVVVAIVVVSFVLLGSTDFSSGEV